MEIPEWLKAHLQRAIDKLPLEKRVCAHALFELAHRNALTVLSTNGAVAPEPRDLGVASLARAAIDRLAREEIEAMEHRSPLVSRDGALWAPGVYRQLDAGWLTSLIAWMIYSDRVVSPFPTDPQTIRIPDQTTIALLGDWGGGVESPAGLRVGRSVKSKRPEYTIHLGDVYYYGGLLGRERLNLVAPWPGEPGTSFALNSNHEMYAGAHGYFDVALGHRHRTPFSAQKGTSYFALENDDWVILGLDSAYFSSWCELYMDGRLDETQLAFVDAQVRKGKGIIVLTHHHGLTLDGLETTPLWQQVVPLLSHGGYWYWGHMHAGVIYTPQPGARLGAMIHARCVGHGCIPCGRPWELVAQRGGSSPTVEWFEETPAPRSRLRVRNGFALLTLDGDELTEQFFDERGEQTYPPREPG